MSPGALWLAGLAGQQAPGIHLFQLHGAGLAGVVLELQEFYVDDGNPNSGPHASIAGTSSIPSDEICIFCETIYVLKDK